MDNAVARKDGGTDVAHYDPEGGLKKIAVADAATKHFRHAKDEFGRRKLAEAVDLKLKEQAAYIVWRDGEKAKLVEPKRSGKGGTISNLRSYLPDADPGDKAAHRWRKRLCKRIKGNEAKKITLIDLEKLVAAISLEQLRCQQVCEQEPNKVRGTTGTGENEWFTPADVIHDARRVLGVIDLDPASTEQAQATVQALQYFTIADDGLKREWAGNVWLNPPYAQPYIEQFADKMIAEIDACRVKAAIMLTHNYTDTAWFQKLAKKADAVCFPKGRIRFIDPDGELASPTQGQAFFYFGTEASRFIDVFHVRGVVGALQ